MSVKPPTLSKESLNSYYVTYSYLFSAYCWLHGTSYIKNHLQGQATGCYVNHSRIDVHENALITTYYLWLPYLLSLLFTLAKLPHSLWKRHFENNLVASIIGSSKIHFFDDEFVNDNIHFLVGIEAARNIGKGNNSQNKKNENNNNTQNSENGGNGKGKGQGNEKKVQPVSPKQLAYNFMEFRHRFKSYHMQFCLLESLNIFTLILSILVCLKTFTPPSSLSILF